MSWKNCLSLVLCAIFVVAWWVGEYHLFKSGNNALAFIIGMPAIIVFVVLSVSALRKNDVS